MKTRETHKFLISKGRIISLYNDEISILLQKELKAKSTIERVSHVKPIPGENEEIIFEADLAPVGGPKLTGFKTRKKAIQAEIDWVNEHLLIPGSNYTPK